MFKRRKQSEEHTSPQETPQRERFTGASPPLLPATEATFRGGLPSNTRLYDANHSRTHTHIMRGGPRQA